MIVEHDGNGFVVLDRATCLELLARRHLAVVAITDGAMPLVLPALYGLWEHDVVIAVDPGGVLGRHIPNNIISLCVHDYDDELTAGWNVTVTGRADPSDPPLDSSVLGPLRTWGPDPSRQLLVRVDTTRVAGRAIQRRDRV